MKIYVVLGSMGEYSDREIWMVEAYSDEKLAKERVIKAEVEGKRLYELFRRANFHNRHYTKWKNKYDEKMEIPYDEPTYYYEEVNLIGY